jgi:hypothetical protein
MTYYDYLSVFRDEYIDESLSADQTNEIVCRGDEDILLLGHDANISLSIFILFNVSSPTYLTST